MSHTAPVARSAPEPAALTYFDAWRAGRRARRGVGADQVALAPSLLATIGLAMVRRRDRAPAGFAVLAASGAMAYFSAARATRHRR